MFSPSISVKKKLYYFLYCLAPFLLGVFSFNNVMAQGNLLITPKRIVFNGQNRFQEINLANIGEDTARYSVSFLQFRMKDNGSFEQITQPDSGQNFSDKYLRIFPRTVTLGPKEAQVIKVQVTRSTELSAGEYRSHLYFRALKDKAPLGLAPAKTESKGLSVQLIPTFGISIPIIIQVGQSTARLTMDRVKIEKLAGNKPGKISLRLNRTGNMSMYGDLEVTYVSDKGKATPVATAKGVAVYTPNKVRYFTLDLEKKEGINYQKGTFRIVYTTLNNNKPQTLAQAEIPAE
jgi:hypothetical protein